MAQRFLSVSRRCGFQSLILMLGVTYLLVIYVFHSDLPHSNVSDEDWAQMKIGEDGVPQQKAAPHRRRVDEDRQMAFDVLRQRERTYTGKVLPNVEFLPRFAEVMNIIQTVDKGDQGQKVIHSVPLNQGSRKTFPSSLDESNIPTGCKDFDTDQEFQFHTIASAVHVYSAFLDSRPNDFDNRHNGSYIRIMAIIRGHARLQLNCSFETNPKMGPPLTSPIHYYELCENHGRVYGGFILSCPVPDLSIISPCSVAVTFRSEAHDKVERVRLRIRTIDPLPHRRTYTICVPPMFGSISSARLVEFLEISRILGADHVRLYDFNIPNELTAVIEYFNKKGFVSVVPWKLDQTIDTNIWYHGQILAIQDCMYRSMATSSLVAFNDVDEVIVPHTVQLWSEMMKILDDQKRCAFQFSAAFFRTAREESRPSESEFAGLSLQTMIMLERTSRFDTVRTKCMVKAFSIFEKGIHHVSKPIWANLEVHRVDPDVARLHHYRACLHGMGMNCVDYEEDKAMLRYKAELVSAVNSTKYSLKGIADL